MARQSATAQLQSHGQSIDSITNLVKDILGKAGCPRCGRLALLHMDFIVDPGPDLTKHGVTSIVTEGLQAH